MSDARCDACRFFREASTTTLEQLPFRDDAAAMGECHRHAPRLNQHPERPDYRWPVTKVDDWCGDFQPHDG